MQVTCAACESKGNRSDAKSCGYCRAALVNRVESIWRDPLPVLLTNMQLKPGEVCHASRQAFYNKTTGYPPVRRGEHVVGRLMLTSTRLLFRARDAQFEVDWKAAVLSELQLGTMYIRVPSSSGSGFYTVDPNGDYVLGMMRRLIDSVRPEGVSSSSGGTEGVVYLFRRGTEHKIGQSENPVRRYHELAAQGGIHGVPVHEISTNDMNTLERHWHSHFAQKRANGEWFRLTEDDVREFCSYRRVDIV